MVKLIAFDFDDTLTDTSTTGPQFEEKYEQELLRTLNRKDERDRFRRVRERVLANPQEYGWERAGVIVARATSDHFILNRTAATLWFAEEKLFQSGLEREAFLELLYSHCYAAAPVRAEAAGLVDELRHRGNELCVITNSAPDRVERALGDAGVALAVRGHAVKFVVDSNWSLPGGRAGTLAVPGLSRAVALQRRQYHDTLEDFCKGEWAQLTVVGDNFELDLALPFAMGASIVLITTPRTPQYELDFVRANGRVIGALSELLL